MELLNNSWDPILKNEYQKEYFIELENFLNEEYNTNTIYPSFNNVLYALKLTEYDNVKVVIIGQDPYHEPFQAHGLAFSVQDGVKIPPSLKNIFKEVSSDIGCFMGDSGDLSYWGEQGVLLLNNVLTVRKGQADSHKNKGWEIFTDELVRQLNQKDTPIVFIFWGNNAKAKQELITNPRHLVLTAPHPSPLSAYHGFFGCKHFSKANQFLIENKQKPIDWKISNKSLLIFD